MSSSICIDASLALRWILPNDRASEAESLLKNWDEGGNDLISPPLFDIEVTSAIRKLMHLGRLSVEEGELAYSLYRELSISIINHSQLSTTAWRLAAEYNLPLTFEMQYLALAELEKCEFWTADAGLLHKIQPMNNRINLLPGHDRQRTPGNKRSPVDKNARPDFPGLWREI